MSGITPRPRAVTIQFLAVTATPGSALARPMPAPQHIRFIVKPAKKDGQHLARATEYFLLQGQKRLVKVPKKGWSTDYSQ